MLPTPLKLQVDKVLRAGLAGELREMLSADPAFDSCTEALVKGASCQFHFLREYGGRWFESQKAPYKTRWKWSYPHWIQAWMIAGCPGLAIDRFEELYRKHDFSLMSEDDVPSDRFTIKTYDGREHYLIIGILYKDNIDRYIKLLNMFLSETKIEFEIPDNCSRNLIVFSIKHLEYIKESGKCFMIDFEAYSSDFLVSPYSSYFQAWMVSSLSSEFVRKTSIFLPMPQEDRTYVFEFAKNFNIFEPN